MKIYLSVLCFFITSLLVSQNSSDWYSKMMIRNLVHELSDDKYEGRQAGEVGGEKAGEYILRYLKNVFKHADNVDVYTQEFEFSFSKNPHKKNVNEGDKVAKNILCFIDNNQNETLVIGAHYDHVGFGYFGSRDSEGKRLVHNGADDNASGVALGITLMDILYDSNKSYNYLFIAFDGEEMGLYGSSFFCKNPTIDLSDIRFMLNFDMVGRLNENRDLAINGSGTSSKWQSLISDSNNDNNFSLKLSESGIGPSDHSSFYLQDIPAIHFFTGQHNDYHTPRDKRNTLNYDGIFEILKFADVIIDLSSSISDFDFKETKNNSNQTPKFSVTLGVMPDYLYGGKGMRIDGVSKEKTAGKFGIKKGDIVIKIGSVDVVDMMSYMQGLSNFKKGDGTVVRILREGKEIDISVVFQ